MSQWTDNAEKAATQKGCIVVRPEEHELFVDIDDAEPTSAFSVLV